METLSLSAAGTALRGHRLSVTSYVRPPTGRSGSPEYHPLME